MNSPKNWSQWFFDLLKKLMSLYKLQPMEDADQGQLWLMKTLDLLPNPFFLIDYQQKRVSFSNSTARQMLGLEYAIHGIAEIYEKELSVFYPDGSLVPIQNLPSARVARGEKIDGEEFLINTLTGMYNIKVFSGEIPKLHNRPAVGLIIFQDITTIKATESTLLRAQSDLNEAVENAMVGFWSVDKQTKKVTISKQLEKQFNLESDEYDGTLKSIIARIHPEDVERVEQAINNSLTTGAPYRIEYRVPHKDGSVRWVEARSAAPGDQNADTNRFSGTTIDITDRVNSRLRLEASEREFRVLADSMPQIVWSADASGELDYFNQVWFDYSGSTYEVNKGNGWVQFVHPDDIAHTILRWKKSLETCEPYENEFRLRNQAGEYRWHVVRARVIFKDESKQEVKKWYGTNTDIHDQKRLTEKLAEARTAAERANSAKSQFLANMSHEIRTPLGAIIGFSALIKEKVLGHKESEEFISVIERNSAQLLRIIDDILDLSKVEAGMMLIENVAFSLPDTLTEFSSQMSFKARAKGIRFNLKATTPIPTSIISDVTRIRQILMNVVGNAIKFTDTGFVELRVKYENEILEFEVQDTGRGISNEQAKILFQPFTQADASTTRKYGGTGLGLTLTRSLAEVMGGTFELVHSELGSGSVFIVRLRAKSAKDTPLFAGFHTEYVSTKSVESQGQLSGMRVLLVEDSPDNQALISIYLSRAAAVIDIASNGQEGRKMATSKDYDIVLMDVQMPVMDGITAVKKLRDEGYTRPIIALTAHAMKEERIRCLEAGFTEFLTKPVSREELINMIQNFQSY